MFDGKLEIWGEEEIHIKQKIMNETEKFHWFHLKSLTGRPPAVPCLGIYNCVSYLPQCEK